MTNPFFEHQDCVILLHQGLKQKNTLTRVWKNHSKLHHFKKIRDQMTSYLGQVENNQPPHVLRIKYAADGVPIHYTVYSSRFWLRSLGLFWALLHLRWWLCGLKVLRGQWIWLLSLEAACRPCHRKWTSPMGSVCHRRSNRPPGNPLVPTVSIRGFYLNQSSRAAQLWRGTPTSQCFAKVRGALVPVYSNSKLI